MTKKRLVLAFPSTLVDQPIVYHLVKDYDLMVNILRGVVSPKQPGKLVVEITGKKKSVDDGLNYLTGLGVELQPLAQDIKWHEDKCISCTSCVPICPRRCFTSTMMRGCSKPNPSGDATISFPRSGPDGDMRVL